MVGARAVTVREVDLADTAELERLIAFEAEHGTPRVRTVTERRGTFPATWPGVLLAAEDAEGDLVGSGAAHVVPAMRPGTVTVNGIVRRGEGADPLVHLMSHIEGWVGIGAPIELLAHVLDPTREERDRWLAAGFAPVGERIRLQRLLTGADRELEVSPPDGLRVVALVERPQLERAAAAVWVAAHRDIPSAIPFETSGDHTLRDDLELAADAPLPDSLAIAVTDDDEVAGVAYLAARGGSEGSYGHRFTGVTPAWRGRGVARALKAHMIRWAARAGARELFASNDEDNAAMRAVNDAFGYRQVSTIVMYRR